MSRPKPLRAGQKGKIGGISFEVGSGNVFRDLGLPDPELRLGKSLLARQINSTIRAKGWTQSKAASELGTPKATIALLKKGMLQSISYDQLISWLLTLKQSVTMIVSPVVRNAQVEVEVVSDRVPPTREQLLKMVDDRRNSVKLPFLTDKFLRAAIRRGRK